MINLRQKLALKPPAAPHKASSLTAATRPLICSHNPSFVPLITPKRPPTPSYFRAPSTRSYQLFCATCRQVCRACFVADMFLLGDQLRQVIKVHHFELDSYGHSTYTQQSAKRNGEQSYLLTFIDLLTLCWFVDTSWLEAPPLSFAQFRCR